MEVDGCYNIAIKKLWHIFVIFQIYACNVILPTNFKMFTVIQRFRTCILLHIGEAKDEEIKQSDWKQENHIGTEDKTQIYFRLLLIAQLLSHVQLFETPWTAAHQAFLSFTISQSLLKLLSIELEMPSNNLILCWPLLLPPSTSSSIRVFSSESALHIRWPKYWSFSFSTSPSNE